MPSADPADLTPREIRAAEPPPITIHGELAELWGGRSLLWALVGRDLRTRYVGSAIGFLWTVINPLLELVTFTFVFHVLIGVRYHPTGDAAHYVLFLFSGMITWGAFADGITRATTSVRDNAHLVRKMRFPVAVLPAQAVLSATLNQVFRLAILLPGAVLLGDGLDWHVLLVPIFIVVQACFTFGIGLLLATLNVYYRDVSHWVEAALRLGMFVTPVFYPASAYPRALVLLLYPNPMAQLVGIQQGLVLDRALPATNSMTWAALAAVSALALGAWVFAHSRRQFADLV